MTIDIRTAPTNERMHRLSVQYLTLVLFLGASVRASSQSAPVVVGHVRESVTGTAVSGAVVALLDSANLTLARTISTSDGTYQLPPAAGAASIRAIHIGYAPVTQAIHIHSSAGADTADLRIVRLPTLLGAVHVLDQPRCPAAADAMATFALWEQARAALLATVVARESNPASLHMIWYDRIVSEDRTRVERQTVAESVFVGSEAVTSHRTASDYETLGYRDSDRERNTDRYYAPDADVLLDPAFARTHCLSLRDSAADHPDQIGLAFAPVPDGRDSLVDVVGTIWIGRTSRTLHSIEFHFTGASDVRLLADTAAGGGVWYEAMPNGVSIATRWNLHAPIRVREQLRVRGQPILASTSLVAGMHEGGGELASAQWKDGDAWDARLPRVRGRVVAAGSGAPLSRVPVGIRGTAFQAGTDSLGAFVLPPIVPGTYAVEAVDTSFAAFDLSLMASADITVDRLTPATVTLVLPSRVAIVDSLCAESRRDNSGVQGGTALLAGQVSLSNGAVAVDAVIRAQWTDPSISDTTIVRLQGRSNANGAFQICGMPVRAPVRISATLDSLVTPDASVTAQADGDVARVSLQLTGSTDPRLAPYRRRVLQITDDVSGAPLAAVEVLDGLTERAIGRTSSAGRLGLAGLAEGSTLVRIRKPGYEQRTLMLAVQPGDTLPVEIKLRTVAQLAAVKVTAKAVLSRRAVASGFEDRAKMHFGHFLTPADMERRWGEPMDAALASAGVRQRTVGSAIILIGGHRPPGCPVTIYIDGMLYYSSTWPLAKPPDASRMNAADYAAVEFYPDVDGAPVQFSQTGGACGILVLWTRD